MKITILVVVTTGLLSCTLFPMQRDETQPELKKHSLLQEQGKPTQQLLGLLEVLDVHHDDDTLPTIVGATQKAWLRKGERWEMQQGKEEEIRDQLMPIFKELGFVDEVCPQITDVPYDNALLLSNVAPDVRLRWAHLKYLWDQGTRFNKVVVLSAAIPLLPVYESKEVLLTENKGILPFRKSWEFDGVLPTNQTEMIDFIREQSDLPTAWDRIPQVWIDTPMKTNGARPNTADTVNYWLKDKPKPGTCLSVTNQPYVLYQDSVVRTLLPKEFELTTVGTKAGNDCSVGLYLDTIARTLFQENKRRS